MRGVNLWLAIFTLVYPLSGQDSDSLLLLYREIPYPQDQRVTDSALHTYLLHRFTSDLDSCFHDTSRTTPSPQHTVLMHLLEGHCHLYGPVKSDAEAYRCYLKAWDLSKDLGNQVLEAECLRNMIRYGLFTRHHLDELNQLIDQHAGLAADTLEKLQNTYFRLRYQAEKDYLDHGDINYDPETWRQIIDRCQRLRFYRLETELRSVFAQILDFCGQTDQAYDELQNAMRSARLHSEPYYHSVRFTSLTNLGHYRLRQRLYGQALEIFREVMKTGVSDELLTNQAKLYDWVAECFEQTGQADSAFHYLNISYQKAMQAKADEHATAVREIQIRYDNERLQRFLTEESLKRKNNNLMALLGGLFLLLIIFLIWQKYDRQRQEATALSQQLKISSQEARLNAINAHLDGQETERRILASHLHDHIVGQIVAANLHLKVAGKAHPSSPLQKSMELMQELGNQVRNISHRLYPPVLLKLGIGPAIIDLCEKYSNNQLQFTANKESDAIRYRGDNVSKIYYIVQELLNNVLKHSQATRCEINLQDDDHYLQIDICDNGTGFSPDPVGAGLGLQTVKARIESLEGNFECRSHHAGGTHFVLKIPVGKLSG